jgi:plastocyanin
VPVEDAAVVLEPTSGTPVRSSQRAAIEQRGREFVPYLTIVQKGASVDFPNHDPFKHHVYSFSPAKAFEIKLYAGKPASPVVFDKTGEVVLGCNIHDWMEAYALVVDTPWFAKTGADGAVRIERVPAGAYRLRLWHPRQKAAVANVGVDLGAASRHFDLTIDVAPRVIIPRPPLDAGGY